MAKTLKATPSRDSARKQAVIYARVSSKEQEKEGFSIPSQLKLLKEYAATQGSQWCKILDIETAKQTGRVAFGEMVAYLKKHPSIRVMLVEKTDRLYRNLKDWVTVDELDVEIHLPKEGVVLSRESRSSEKFMHGIKVLMAKNYIDNLSEEARKGMQEKAEQGIWPTVAPLGYRNVAGPDGKKIIEPNPNSAAIIARLFEWFATGTLSLKKLRERQGRQALFIEKSGAAVPVSTVHTTLRNRIYAGEFEWSGQVYLGKHNPWSRANCGSTCRASSMAVTPRRPSSETRFCVLGPYRLRALWLLDRRGDQERRYIYYRCTGFKGRCDEPYVREEVIERQFSDLLGRLSSTTKCWNGCVRRSTPAMLTRGASTERRSSGSGPNTTELRTASTRCTWTSSTER